MPTDQQINELINILQKLYDGLVIRQQRPQQGQQYQQQRETPRDRREERLKKQEQIERTLLFRKLSSNIDEQKRVFNELPSVLERSTSRFYTVYGTSLIDKIVNQSTYKQLLDELPEKLRVAIADSGSEVGLRIGRELLTGTAEDFTRLQTSLKNIDKILSLAEEYFSLTKEQREIQYERYQQKLQEVGYSIDLFGNSLEEARRNAKEFVRVTTRSLEQLANTQTRQFSRAFNRFFQGFSITAAGIVAKNVVDTLARYGTTLGSTLSIAARMTGMSVEELAATQAQYRQEILATGGNFQQFNQWLADSAWSLRLYTSSLTEGARVAASNIRTSLIFGSSVEEINQLLAQQNNQFKQWNRLFGMTADEFIEFNNMLISNATIQGQLYMISQNQRKAYMDGIRANYELLRTFGLLDDEAKNVLQSFQAMGVMSPRERLRQAYRIQALAGAMGMGAVGAEAAQLLIRGLRTPEDQQRFAELTRNMTQQISLLSQQGFGTELVLRSLLERMDLDRYFGPQGEFSKFATRQLLQLEKNVVEQQKQTTIFGEIGGQTGQMIAELAKIAVASADILSTNRQLLLVTTGIAAMLLRWGRGGLGVLRQGPRIGGRFRGGRGLTRGLTGSLALLGGFAGLGQAEQFITELEQRSRIQDLARSQTQRGLLQRGGRLALRGILRGIPVLGSIAGIAMTLPKMTEAWEAGNIGSAITYGVAGLLGPIGLVAESALEAFGIISTGAEKLTKNLKEAEELARQAERELQGEQLKMFIEYFNKAREDGKIQTEELRKLRELLSEQVEETKKQTETISKQTPVFRATSTIDIMD